MIPKILVWLGFGVSAWAVLGIIICAACGSFLWAMGCFFAGAFIFFVSYREADALAEDERWRDAYDPRL